MKIQSPIIGVARTSLNRTAHAIERSLARLSSGREVSSPRDNSAAYSMGVTLESQVRGLKQGVLNANQAQSLLMTAESAVTSQLDLVQRMRELAVQASNGTLSTNDRDALNTELQGLLDEFTRIARSTEFNGSKLLDGSTLTRSIQIGDESIDLRLNDLTSENVFRKTAGTGAFTFSATFETSGSGNTGRNSKVGDINNDGHLDFAIATNPVEVFLGDGEGGFTRSDILNGGEIALNALELVDVTNDGILDIVSGEDGTVAGVWQGNGDGTFTKIQTLSTPSGGSLTTGDVDGDGDIDIITSDYTVAGVSLNDGQGQFSVAQTFVAASVDALRAVDLNNDGKAEIIGAGSSLMQIYSLNSSGAYSLLSTAPKSSSAFAFDVGDLDQDGDLDIAVIDYTGGGMTILKNSGAGTFTVGTTITGFTHSDPYRVIIADINEDGLNDILWNDASTNLATTLLGTGQGNFASAKTTDLSQLSAAFPLSLGDFDEDGVLDMVVPDRENSQFGIYLGNSVDRIALTDLDFRSQSKSQVAIEVLDNALESLQAELSQIGAIHNRLDSTISSNLLLSESLDEARSKAIDADIAKETSELVRNQILQQAQIAVLAQANTQMQLVMELLSAPTLPS